jgi:hypothetical protein
MCTFCSHTDLNYPAVYCWTCLMLTFNIFSDQSPCTMNNLDITLYLYAAARYSERSQRQQIDSLQYKQLSYLPTDSIDNFSIQSFIL